ncbi:MAG TPA: TonB-dependent receptor [Gemmatimonadales bacterium]|nr:TonB-dependent receptor [Gemmatimonadales bacterium]
MSLLAGAAHGQGTALELDLLSRPARLALTDVPLERALGELQRASGVRLAFSPDLLPQRQVSCDCRAITVREALARLLAGADLTVTATRSQVLIAPNPEGAGGTPLRQGTIVGVVRATETDQPLAGVLIRVDGQDAGASDRDGRFTVPWLPTGTHRLVAASIGYSPIATLPVEVGPGDTTSVTLYLHRMPVMLSDVVVMPGRFAILEGAQVAAVQQTMTRQDIETVPQIGEDAFRVIHRLPGVASDDISTKLNVRGGTDDQLLVMLDGLRLYEPYHLQDFDGALGIVDVQALGGINLMTGGFPVEYGNKLVGVYDMTSRGPPATTRTALGASLTNLTFQSQGTFAGGRGDWLASARRGYLDIVLSLAGGDDLSPQYYDLFGKVRFSPWSHHVFAVHGLYARDRLRLDATGDPSLGLANGRGLLLESSWGSEYGWVSWQGSFGRLSGRGVASAGRLTRARTGMGADPGRLVDPEAVSVSDQRRFDVAELRQDWQLAVSERVLLRAGLEATSARGDYDYLSTTRSLLPNEFGELAPVHDTLDLAITPTGSGVGAYLAARGRPWDELTAEFGARYDRTQPASQGNLSPRVLGSLALGSAATLRASWGTYVQSDGVQAIPVADGDTVVSPPERATQVAFGVERAVGDGVRLRLETYRRVTGNPRVTYLSLHRELQAFPEIERDRVRLAPQRSRSWGVEFTAQREAGRGLAWSASYVLAFAQDLVNQAWIPRALDQRHTVAVQLVYRPSTPWQVSWAWQFHSGWPITAPVFGLDTLASGAFLVIRRYDRVNDTRLPAYHRMDARVTREFRVANGRLLLYLDVFNLYDRQNLRNYGYDIGVNQSAGVMTIRRTPGEDLIPILPSLGARWEF